MPCDDTSPKSPVRSTPLPAAAVARAKIKRENSGGSLGGGGPNEQIQNPSPGKRTVCDHCRRRRIRCDGQFPCQQCNNAALTCKREHVPKKRGPKRGHGRVINELRAREKGVREPDSASGSDVEADPYPSDLTSTAPSPPTQPWNPWTTVTSDSRNETESKGPFTCDTFRPKSRNYLYLVPQCVDLYYEHIYPIMPLLYMPTIRTIIARPMTPSEKNLIYALSALTALHMSGRSLSTPGPPSWELVGRFFLDECISARQSYDFPEDMSLNAVISSFWLSTSFFEINQSRKSWYYLREALTQAIDIRLHDNTSYVGLPVEEQLCRQRVFWILFVTERSFAILRNKPLTLRRTPSLPTTKHDYEAPEIHSGFLKLVSSYAPLDESFVNAWNDGNDPQVSATTYLNLQQILAQPLDFLRPKRKSPSPPLPSDVLPLSSAPYSTRTVTSIPAPATASNTAVQPDNEEDPDPTTIQKADLLVTQQWLRLIVWQSSFRQGLLSTAAPHESFTFSFPLTIARDTASVLHSLPSRAVEVHGMGIFEKIFEIGTWCVNVMGAYDAGSSSPLRPFDGAGENPVRGMDFVGGELAFLGGGGVGRSAATVDPVEFFVKTLSASPNSRAMFAEKLLMFAGETPGGTRTTLSPGLSSLTGVGIHTGWSDSGRVGPGASVEGTVKHEPEATRALALDLDLESDLNLNTDRVMGNGDIGMVGARIGFDMVSRPGTGATTYMNNDIGLGLINTQNSEYSMAAENGPISAGLSVSAFSEATEYGLGNPFVNGVGRSLSRDMTFLGNVD
ncbi:uncharacterized protein BCR38DRAFT_527591 [Pseudomassariella vexata]|uniref:Zn(2)-C6 fungal-type domain-containing protein n=1 Tax=Pseudomassariella vexata TaxID=1141098 RepID=A0A1Y2DHH7_9PEZI|nr:uncharacterized protein BCR38DRAFT_527591 [Pseudomassariella vexata]ORY58586.1 hypothetical protein BCR38DRAFT_527591 [Pseudomassariella vexata]